MRSTHTSAFVAVSATIESSTVDSDRFAQTGVHHGRWRRILLALYLLAAAADATGKAIESDRALAGALTTRLNASGIGRTIESAPPHGNFEIFRRASRHLLTGQDLYASYPDEISDRFKYSPTFAFLFLPLALLPYPLALFLWSALNALVLFVAVERVLPGRASLVALSCLLPEVVRAMQNSQSNALVAGLIILAFSAIARARLWRAAAAVSLGALVKIFPLAALSLGVPARRTVRFAMATAACVGVLLLLPLTVTSPATLLAQYASWRAIESTDALQRWFSVMALLQQWIGGDWPNWPAQLGGTILLLLPLAVQRRRWDDPRFRATYLASLLVYVVLFNHQAERASFVIAMAGVALWCFGAPLGNWRVLLALVPFLTVTLMSTLIPVPAILKSPVAMLYRLTLPMLVIWAAMQWDLYRRPTDGKILSPA